MHTMSLKNTLLLAVPLTASMLLACGTEKKPNEVSFQQDVMPILKARCLACHIKGGKGYEKSGLLMDSYENLLKGTKFGKVIVPGNSLNSVFNQVVEGRVDKSITMPHGGEQLVKTEIEILKTWVDQGAKNN
jgi:hypothetical protein